MNTHTASSLVRGFIGRHPCLLAGAAGSVLMNRILSIVLPLSLGLFFEVVAAGHGGAKERLARLLPMHPETAGGFFWLLAFLVVAQAVFAFLERFAAGVAGLRFAQELQSRLFSVQMRQTPAARVAHSDGSQLLRYTADARAVQGFLTKGLLGVSGDMLVLAGAFALLSSLQPRWALVTASGFAVAAGVVLGLSRLMKTSMIRHRSDRARVLRFVNTRLQAFLTVKVLNRENREIRHFERLSQRRFASGRRQVVFGSLAGALPPLFFYATTGLILGLALHDTRAGTLPFPGGELLTFVLVLLYLRGVMRRLLGVPAHWHPGRLSLQRLARVLNTDTEPRSSESGDRTASAHSGVTLHDLIIDGPQTPRGQAGVNGCLRSGTTTVIRGHGKGRLLRVLLKLEAAPRGNITLDGADWGALCPWEARKRLAFAGPDAPLLGKTVFAAISYRPDRSRRDEAARLLDALGFTGGSDCQALDRPVDTADVRLTASERALLQLARALMTRKRILLLDEPFRNLDHLHLHRVVDHLNGLRPTHCLIVAADTIPEGLVIDATWDLARAAADKPALEEQEGQVVMEARSSV